MASTEARDWPPSAATEQGTSIMNKRTLLVALAALAAAGVTLVPIDMGDIFALNDRVSLAIALHEPIDDLQAWLAANAAATRVAAVSRAVQPAPQTHARALLGMGGI